jgi:beta-galactosidase/beta-glucuronidase
MKYLICGLSLLVFSTSLFGQSPREKINFNSSWRFHLGDAHGAQFRSFDNRDWRTLNVPHDWSIEQPFSAKNASGQAYLPGGIGWYRKSFTLPDKFRGKEVKVLFDGVYDDARVWINGHYLGIRPYGFISFSRDLTPYLTYGSKRNELAVRVDHSHGADSRWYTGSGIDRNVWLIVTDPVHIAQWGVFVSTPAVNKGSAKVKVVTKIINDTKTHQTLSLESKIFSSNKSVADKTTTVQLPAHSRRKVLQVVDVKDPQRWSTTRPYLYKLKSFIYDGSRKTDVKSTSFGIRSFRFSARKGFFLNGKSMKIKGVCLHNDAGPLGSAVPVQEWKRRLQLMKEMGANAIRTSHNPPDPELLNLADRMGFLVMDEAFDEWKLGKKKWIKGTNVDPEPGAAGLKVYYSLHGYHDFFREWHKQDIQDMVRRDRNHPSVILWSIGNEIDYPNDPYTDPSRNDYQKWRPSGYQITTIASRLYDDIKTVDPTRPVTAALADVPRSNKIGYASVLDVVGYNYQERYYQHDHEKFPKRKIIGSENGDSYKAWLAVKNNEYIPGQFLWTGVDYLGEAGRFPNHASRSGLVTLDDYRKPGFYFRKSLWTDKPMVYLAVVKPHSKEMSRNVVSHWNWRAYTGKKIEVIAYTNAKSVELFQNNQSLGTKKLANASGHVIRWKVAYHPGTLRAVARNQGKEVAHYALRTANKASKIVLRCNRSAIAADGNDIASVKVLVTDQNGTVVPDAGNMIHFKVSGAGKNIGVGDDNYNSISSYKSSERKAYKGKARIIIRSTKQNGVIRLKATSKDLKPAKLAIRTVDGESVRIKN